MLHIATRQLLPLLFGLATTTGLNAPTATPNLTDPEVANVVVTANTIDIDFARLAESRSQNKEVLSFAATMITDHSAVNQQAAALAKRLGITPLDNAVSQSLQKGAADARTAIVKLQGAAFDRAYMEREVAYHQAVLDALDGLLIPSTSNADLKQLEVAVRPAIAAHLAHAKQILASLGAGA